MNLSRLNILLALLLVIVMLLTRATRVDYTRPNIEILPDMKYTQAYLAYSRNPVFANGRTLQTPVSGTIARGQMPLHFEATKEDAIRAGEELANSFLADTTQDTAVEATGQVTAIQQSIQRGGDTYRIFCICCHGPTGGGDGPVTQRGFPPPPSLVTGNSRQMKDGQLFHILTYGQASMPEFNGQLAPQSRWDLINFIRSLQKTANSQSSGSLANTPVDDGKLPGTEAIDARAEQVPTNETQPE